MTLSPKQDKVLQTLRLLTVPHGALCCGFATIAREAEMTDVKEVRRIVRQLARKGLAEYHRGLVSEDDGSFAGAGYCISKQGRELVGL